MSSVAGIHFGNTNCVVAVCNNDGKTQTISNETGDRLTPTIVGYTGNEKIIGEPAKQFLIRNPKSCISNIKECIGNDFTEKDLEDLQRNCSCDVSLKDRKIVYNVKVEEDLIEVPSLEAASYIFTKLLEIAESSGGSELEDAVIAVPYSFTENQRIEICEAAESIGFNVLRLISEPAAAALGYGIGQDDPSSNCNVLVFRLGGTSTDATLLRVISGMYQVVGEKRRTHFGAKDFDDLLVQYFAGEFKKKYKEDISNNSRALGKLRPTAEECKRTLSRMERANCSVDSLHDGLDFQTNILRVKFESMCSELLNRCTQLVDELLKEHSFTYDDIQKVLLVGGGTKIPKLIKNFKDKFQSSEVLSNIDSDEIIARGAALQAGLLNSESDGSGFPSSKVKCTSKNIGVMGNDGTKNVLDIFIEKHTPVPSNRKRMFRLKPNQNSILVPIYESPDSTIESGRLLAKIVMKELKQSEQTQEMTVDFQVNKSGNLIVKLTSADGESESVTIDIDHS